MWLCASPLPIERAQRMYQARYEVALNGGQVGWPGGAPAYPPDGFYGNALTNATFAASLVQDLANAMTYPWFLSKFVAGANGDITGFATVPNYNGHPDMKPLGTVTPGNYVQILEVIQKRLQKLQYIRFDAYQTDFEGKDGGFTASDFCQGYGTCVEVVARAQQDYNALPWGKSKLVTGWDCTQSPPGDSHPNGIVVSASSGINYWGYTAQAKNWSGKIAADLSRFQNGGSGQIFLKVDMFGSANHITPTRAPNHTFGKWQGGVKLGDPNWKSGLVEEAKVLPTYYGVCGSGDTHGWSVSEQVLVLKPVFDERPSGDRCQKCVEKFCADAEVSSIHYDVPLGFDELGYSMGSLFLFSESPGTDLASPSHLSLAASTKVKSIRDSGQTLRQILAPEILVDVVTNTAYKYDLRFFTAANAGTTNAQGIYQPIGAPFKTITVENPNGATTNTVLRFTESQGGNNNVSEYTYSGNETISQWTLVTGGGLRKETVSSQWDPDNLHETETTEIRGSSNELVRKEVRRYQLFPWGRDMISRVLDPDGAALTTTWSYYQDASTNGYGYVSQRIDPTGYWERYEYDAFGRETKRVSQYLNAPVGAPESQCRVLLTTYGDVDPAVTMVEKLLGQEVSRSYNVNKPGEDWNIRCSKFGAAWNDPSNLVTITRYLLGTAFEGEIQSIQRPDGTMTIYDYALAGNQKTTTVKSGQPNAAKTDIVDGMRTVTVEKFGTQLSQTSYDILTGLLLFSSSATQVDALGRPTRVDYNDGTFETKVYNCCGLESETDREGIPTTYVYDALKRVVAVTRTGITTLQNYDAESRVTQVKRKGSDNSEIVQSGASFDVAGRQVSSTNAMNFVTLMAETKNGSGQTVRTTTYPNGSTRIETFHQDGSLASVGGTAAHPLRYDYGVDTLGRWTKEIRIGAGGSETEWVKAYSDILGRPSRNVQSGGATTQSFYNNLGQLVREIDPDGVTVLHAYNGRGEREYSAIDMNQNGVIDYAGTDRIVRTVRDVATAHATTVQRQTTSVWTTDNANTSIPTSVEEVSADGLQAWNTRDGLTTHAQTIYDHVGGRRSIVTYPDGTTGTNVFQNGFLTFNFQPSTFNSYTYDPHGRVSTSTDARGITTTQTYFNDDQVKDQTLSNPVLPVNPVQTTSFTYDNMGRVATQTLPDGGIQTTHYHDTGEKKDVSGTRVYTTQYTYDGQGRLKTLLSGTGLTTWNYHPATGLLISKLYADGKGPTYTYTPAGRVKTRTWARGVTATYGYNNAGDVTSTTYSDSTPAVAAVYDRRGRTSTLSSQPSTLNYSYNTAGQILAETYTAGVLNGMVVSNSYDALLRRNNQSVILSGAKNLSVSSTYDTASRLLSVNDDLKNLSATYAYLPKSSLINTITFKRSGTSVMTTTNSYDGFNRLTSIQSVIPSEARNLSFAYAYNQANQRTRATREDNAYWSYDYDPLGQVTSGKKFFPDSTPVAGEQFEYAFDSIGNRTQTKFGGDFAGGDLKVSKYSANALNQYVSRTVPGGIDVLGTATANSIVTVNQQPAAIKTVPSSGGTNHFWKSLSVTNSTAAVYQDVKAVAAGATTNVIAEASGKVFVPKTPETFTYDADGNLTQDGRWVYTWDAENRLIAMEGAAPSAPKQRLEFIYDAYGRRISKKIYFWNPSTLSFQLSTESKFLFDSWNCIAEFNGTGTLLRSYAWGLDLSGSEQGAGGVGGLLWMNNTADASSHFYSYDGNGNVAGLVDAATGKISASYEYGAFGEMLRASGSMAKLNAYRFSTKWTDNESGLVYYGYRFYSASIGRWLSREPLGEIESANLYRFVSNNSVNHYDVLGLNQEDGHFYLTYIVARASGKSHKEAFRLAFYSQVPDEIGSYSAYISVQQSIEDIDITRLHSASRDRLIEIQDYLHSLHGGDSFQRRKCLKKMFKDGSLSPMEKGLLIHPFADSYAHSTPVDSDGRMYEDFDPIDNDYPELAYGAPIGHGFASKSGVDPDLISRRPELFKRYASDLLDVFSGDDGDVSTLDPLFRTIEYYASIQADYVQSKAGFRRLAQSRYGYDQTYAPELFEPAIPINQGQSPFNQGLKVPTEQEIKNLINKIRKHCCGEQIP